ncbi:MAG: acyltransferase [Bacteroidota bacterium]
MTDVFIHPTAVVDAPVYIGGGTKIWHFCHVMEKARIGSNCSLGQNVFVASGVQLGKGVKVQNNVSIYAGVTIEDDVFLGPSMVFTNVKNPRSAISRKGEYEPTLVRKGATIGANATIVCGSEIGAYAFIGAGAVVTKKVKAYALVMGNPGRQTGWMSRHGHRLAFNQEGLATCPESGIHYQLKDGEVNEFKEH